MKNAIMKSVLLMVLVSFSKAKADMPYRHLISGPTIDRETGLPTVIDEEQADATASITGIEFADARTLRLSFEDHKQYVLDPSHLSPLWYSTPSAYARSRSRNRNEWQPSHGFGLPGDGYSSAINSHRARKKSGLLIEFKSNTDARIAIEVIKATEERNGMLISDRGVRRGLLLQQYDATLNTPERIYLYVPTSNNQDVKSQSLKSIISKVREQLKGASKEDFASRLKSSLNKMLGEKPAVSSCEQLFN